MIQTYSVASNTPMLIFSRGDTPTTVYNSSDTVTISVSEDAGINSFPLGPGSRISWDTDKNLYARVPDGATASLITVDNGGSIDDPGILAQLIIDKGLPEQIAAAIKVSGAPPIDVPLQLIPAYLRTNTVNNASEAALHYPTTDISGYQSLTIKLALESAAAPVTSGPASLLVYQYVDNPGTELVAKLVIPLWVPVNFSGRTTTVRIPVMGTTIYLGLNNAGAEVVRFNVSAIASYRACDRLRGVICNERTPLAAGSILQLDNSVNPALAYGWSLGAKTVGTTVISPLYIQPGRARLNIYGNTTAAGRLLIIDTVNTGIVYQTVDVPISATASLSVDLTFPARMCHFYFDPGVAWTGNMFLSVTYQE